MDGESSQVLAVGLVFGFYLVVVGIALFTIVSYWKLFEKARRPRWAAIVPIYGAVVLLRLVGKPSWWVVPLLVPIINLVTYLFLCPALARSFGKGNRFAVGLIFVHVVFLAILAFGRAEYVRSAGRGDAHSEGHPPAVEQR
jgi:hypothetical protein